MFPTLVSPNGICAVDAKRHVLIALAGKSLSKARGQVIGSEYVDPFLVTSEAAFKTPEFGALVAGTELRGYYFGLYTESTIQPIHDFGLSARIRLGELQEAAPIAPVSAKERLRLVADAELAEAMAASAELARQLREQQEKVAEAKQRLSQVKREEEPGQARKRQRLGSAFGLAIAFQGRAVIDISSGDEDTGPPPLEPATQRYEGDDEEDLAEADVDIVGYTQGQEEEEDQDEIETASESDEDAPLVRGKAEKYPDA